MFDKEKKHLIKKQLGKDGYLRRRVMGREIRKVPKNWEHPKYNHPFYCPQDQIESLAIE